MGASGGEVDASQGSCWFDALESQACQIGDTIALKWIEQRSCQQETAGEEVCPGCGQPGHFKADRQRRLQTRRGEVEITEPEYFCSSCRKSFFPDGQSDRR